MDKCRLTGLTGTDLTHVPCKGAGPAVTAVLGGQVLMTFPVALIKKETERMAGMVKRSGAKVE